MGGVEAELVGLPREDDLPGIPREGDMIAGKYTVEKVLGVGGMGAVVAARHIHLGQQVAVKFLLPSAATQKLAIDRFLREARSVVGLHSAHVVRVIDVGTLETGLPYMVMEHLAGRDLAVLLEDRGALPVDEAVDYVLQACEAIAEAHNAGIVHRDIKPSNLFITQRPDGAALVKVLDFGISKATDKTGADKNLTATSSIMGSPIYMSPEQLRSSKNVDTRTDIWALGVLLFELVTGATPFDDETVTGLCAKIVADLPSTLREKNPKISAAFEKVVMRCLEKDVTRRFQTVAELATGLRPFATPEGQLSADRVARIGGPIRPPMTSAPQLPRPSLPDEGVALAETMAAWQTSSAPKRRRTTLYVGVTVGALALAGLGFIALKSAGRESTAQTATAQPPAAARPEAPPSSAGVQATAIVAAAVPSPELSARPPVATTSTASAMPETKPAIRAPVRAPVTAVVAPPPSTAPAMATIAPPPATTAPPPKPKPDDLLQDRK